MFLGVFGVLVRWYKTENMDPKFKRVFVVMAIALLLLGVTINLYIWRKIPKLKECNGGFYFVENYKKVQGYCVARCPAGQLMDTQSFQCIGSSPPAPDGPPPPPPVPPQ